MLQETYKRPHIFKVFLSSTFSDFKTERDYLQSYVFPRLHELCISNNSLFQAVDLRWGISDEVATDQKTLDICINEIRDCKRISPRPSFVALIGNRYGWRPLPTQIPSHVFEDLQSTPLLVEWYEKDENSIPCTYNLKQRTNEYLDYSIWEGIENRLRNDLRMAARNLPESISESYFISATEHEIREGLKASKDDLFHTHCFMRALSDIPATDESIAFTDNSKSATGQIEPDESAELYIQRLKDTIFTSLPEKNIHHFNSSFANRTDIVRDFCECIFDSLKATIEAEMKRLSEVAIFDEALETERIFRKRISDMYIGNNNIQTINEHIKNGSGIISIVGAEGKSALCAAVVKSIGAENVIVRHIGASCLSASGQSLAKGIAQELSISDEGNIHTLINRIRKRIVSGNYVLILDGIDKIRECAVFLQSLSEINKVIVSYTDTQLLHTVNSGIAIELEDLPFRDANTLFNNILNANNRQLTGSQQEYFQTKFRNNTSPTYIKLAAEYACGLSSAKAPSFADNTYSIYDSHISNLIRFHGRIMVAHTLAYIAMSKNGLSYITLYSLVKSDNEIFDEFRKTIYHNLPKDELPITVFAHFMLDIEKFLVKISYRGMELMLLVNSFLQRYITTELLNESIVECYYSFWEQQFNAADEINVTAALSELPSVILNYSRKKDLYMTLICKTDFLEKKFSAKLGDELGEELFLAAQQGVRFADLISGAIAANFQVINENPALALFMLHYSFSEQVLKSEDSSEELDNLLKTLNKPGFTFKNSIENIQTASKYILQTELKTITYIKISPDNNSVLIVDCLGNIILWNISAGVFEEMESPIEMNAVSNRENMFFYGCMPDENTLIISNEKSIWELRAKEIFENGFKYAAWHNTITAKKNEEIGAVNWRNNLLVSMLDTKTGIFKLSEYNDHAVPSQEHDFEFLGKMMNANEIAFSCDGDIALSFANGVVVSSSGLIYHGVDPALSCVFFDNDQKLAVTTSNGRLLIFNAGSVQDMENHDVNIPGVLEQAGEKVIYSEKYRRLIIAGRSGYLSVFSPDDLHCEHIPAGIGQGVLSMALSDDGELLALGSRHGSQVKVFDIETLAKSRSRGISQQAWGDRTSYAHPTNGGYFFEEYYNDNERRKGFVLQEESREIFPLNSCNACVYDGNRGDLIFAVQNQLFMQNSAISIAQDRMSMSKSEVKEVYACSFPIRSISLSKDSSRLAVLDNSYIYILKGDSGYWTLACKIPYKGNHEFGIPLLITRECIIVSTEEILSYQKDKMISGNEFIGDISQKDRENQLIVFSYDTSGNYKKVSTVGYSGFLSGIIETDDGYIYTLGSANKKIRLLESGDVTGTVSIFGGYGAFQRFFHKGDQVLLPASGDVSCSCYCDGLLFLGFHLPRKGEIACIDLKAKEITGWLKIGRTPIYISYDGAHKFLTVIDDGIGNQGVPALYRFTKNI